MASKKINAETTRNIKEIDNQLSDKFVKHMSSRDLDTGIKNERRITSHRVDGIEEILDDYRGNIDTPDEFLERRISETGKEDRWLNLNREEMYPNTGKTWLGLKKGGKIPVSNARQRSKKSYI